MYKVIVDPLCKRPLVGLYQYQHDFISLPVIQFAFIFTQMFIMNSGAPVMCSTLFVFFSLFSLLFSLLGAPDWVFSRGFTLCLKETGGKGALSQMEQPSENDGGVVFCLVLFAPHFVFFFFVCLFFLRMKVW